VSAPLLSIVCVVRGRPGDLGAIHRDALAAVDRTGLRAEFLYLLDGSHPEAGRALRALPVGAAPVRIFRLSGGSGEAAALQLGFERAEGSWIVTIPCRYQVDLEAVVRVVDALRAGADVVATRREPRRDPFLNRLQSRVFHAAVRTLSGRTFHDLTCGVRGLTGEAALALQLYGNLHRFVPVLAARRGFRVAEIPAVQRAEDRGLRLFGPGVYAQRAMDLVTVLFLARFGRRPLHFFGLIGLASGLLGLAITASLAVRRLLGEFPLTDRPLMVLGLLLIVLGVQMASIGLIGESILFFAARRESPRIVEDGPAASAPEPVEEKA